MTTQTFRCRICGGAGVDANFRRVRARGEIGGWARVHPQCDNREPETGLYVKLRDGRVKQTFVFDSCRSEEQRQAFLVMFEQIRAAIDEYSNTCSAQRAAEARL